MSSTPDTGEVEIKFTVKQLLGMLEEKLVEQIGAVVTRLDRIDGKLDDKASRRDLREFEDRYEVFKEKIEGRVGVLENTASGGVAIGKVGMWFIGGVGCAVFLAAVSIISAAISGGHL